MTAIRVTYIICSTVYALALLVFAASAPVLITPGYYWWTLLAICLLMNHCTAFTARLNSWVGMGKV